MATVKAKLKWGKKSFDIDVDTSGTVDDFKAMIMSLTGVPATRQKLMAKGVWKGKLKDDADFSSFTFKPKQKIMLMGKAAEVKAVQREEVVFIEDMTKAEAAKAGAIIPAGFKNLGNTCYMNSTLQCFRAVPELRKALAAYRAGGADPMTRTLANDFDGVDGEAESYPPVGFVMALRQAFAQFDEVDPASHVHKQQDADELFNAVTMKLASTLTTATGDVDATALSKAGGNLVDALFSIKFENTLKCVESADEATVVTAEQARKLRCNIDGGAGAAHQINHMHEGITLGLDGELEKASSVLGRNARWSKRQRISRLPKYLCVQFMRFYWKPTPDSRDRAGVNCKMMRPVTFPTENFDVFEFCNAALKKKLKVFRDKFADEALGGGDESKTASTDESKTSSAAAAAATTDGDTDMAADDDEDDDLAAALALSLGGDVAMEKEDAAAPAADDSDLLGPGIPAEFRGLYELFAVVSHKGRSASSGHYMGWVRASGDDWFCYDDDAVSPCKTEHIKALKGGGDWDMGYILFYRAKA